MSKLWLALLSCCALAFGGYGLLGTYRYAQAQGEASVEDAGVGGFDAGTPVAAGPLAPAAVGDQPASDKLTTIHDPVEDPTGFAEDAVGAYRKMQYAFFVVIGLFGLSRGLVYVSDKFDIPFLDKRRSYLIFGASMLAAAIASLAALSTVDFRAVLGALAAAAVVEWRARGKMGAAARAQQLYEAYAKSTDWKSAVTGAPLPTWDATPEPVKTAWLAAASVV